MTRTKTPAGAAVKPVPTAVCVLAFTMACAVVASAQVTITFQWLVPSVTGPDGPPLIVVNPGSTGGNLCANLYVFDAKQEMQECCSCPTTPNGALKLSVRNDLTSNTLTGVPYKDGVLALVSSAPRATCDGAFITVSGIHIEFTPIPSGGDPNGPVYSYVSGQSAPLSSKEMTLLQAECGFIQVLGSGRGICTCGTGG